MLGDSPGWVIEGDPPKDEQRDAVTFDESREKEIEMGDESATEREPTSRSLVTLLKLRRR